MSRYNEFNLNQGQFDALTHMDGPCLVIAPPGSGKTFVLTNRIRYLCEEKGIKEDEILVITFTKAAAKEMLNRYLKMKKATTTSITFGTFHSVFYMMLRTSLGVDIKGVLSPGEKAIMLDSIIHALNLEECELPDVEMVLSEISKRKGMGQDLFESSCSFMDATIFSRIVRRYENALLNKRCMDFDDLILKTRDMFLQKPKELAYWQDKYRYILIDEFQDINPLQFEVVRLLSDKRKNLFMVGDDDQAIYSFRGSCPELMLSLDAYYPDIRKIYLTVNYRSKASIVERGNRLISNNRKRYNKCVHANTKEEGKVIFLPCRDLAQQNRCIWEKLEEWKDYDNTAILCRTHAGLSKYAALCGSKGIPFRSKERIKNPYRNPVISDIRSYIRLAGDEGNMDDLYRILNKPNRFLSRSLLSKNGLPSEELKRLLQGSISNYSRKNIEKLIMDIRFLKGMNIYGAIQYIEVGMGYASYLKSKDANKEAELIDMLHSIRDRGVKQRGEKGLNSILSDLESEYEKAENNRKLDHGITLITMHASKGLEYKHVIIPDLNEKNIPGRRAYLPDSIEEERRLLFVAMTRAKEDLLLTGIQSVSDKNIQLSRFVREIT